MKIAIFDLDETLFNTKAKIKVIDKNTGRLLKTLSNQEFNNYKLKENEIFDFSEFKDSEFFKKTSKPIKNVINVLRKFQDNKEYQVFILTARENFNNKNIILKFLKKHGINIGHLKNNEVHLIRAGNFKATKISDKKVLALKNYIDVNNIKEIIFFDDNIENLESFKKNFKNIKLELYHVKNNNINLYYKNNKNKGLKMKTEISYNNKTYKDLNKRELEKIEKIAKNLEDYITNITDIKKETRINSVKEYETIFKNIYVNIVNNVRKRRTTEKVELRTLFYLLSYYLEKGTGLKNPATFLLKIYNDQLRLNLNFNIEKNSGQSSYIINGKNLDKPFSYKITANSFNDLLEILKTHEYNNINSFFKNKGLEEIITSLKFNLPKKNAVSKNKKEKINLSI